MTRDEQDKLALEVAADELKGKSMNTKLISELRDEADLCRNEQANDIAKLLDEAANALSKPNFNWGVSRNEWHDKAWGLYHAKTFDDTMLAKVNIHTIRTVFNATFDAAGIPASVELLDQIQAQQERITDLDNTLGQVIADTAKELGCEADNEAILEAIHKLAAVDAERGKANGDVVAAGRTHELKCWPPYFDDVASGRKPFELRQNDRDFKVGDTLILREWLPESQQYTERSTVVRVTYLLEGGSFGLASNMTILGVRLLTSPTIQPAREAELLELIRKKDEALREAHEFIGDAVESYASAKKRIEALALKPEEK